MAQQTAVNFIENNIINVAEGYQYIVLGGEEYVNTKHLKYLFEQAKQMEKEQIINAHTNGQAEFDTEAFRQKVVDNAEQYYNETYGK